MLPSSLVFLDTETTGLSPTRDRIIEVGLVRVENNTIVEKFQTLLNPQMYLSPFITSLTGITPEDIENAPTFREIKRELYALLEGAVLVAHNARFDYAFLKNEFRREEMDFRSKQFCTAKLSRRLFPQMSRHNLDSIIQKYGFTIEKRHRAYDDAYVLWQFYQKVQEEFPLSILEETIQKELKRPSLPLHLSQSFLDGLPQTSGVYIFYGENRVPLYVGKSVNIRDRVLSHFSSDHAHSKEMKLTQQVVDIQTIQTAGELGALLKESQLVKELQPLYNRQLRQSRRLTILRAYTTERGYEAITMEELTDITPEDIPTVTGVFKSRKSAKDFLIEVCKEHMLCEALLGLEKAKTGCFAYRLGKCKGACVGKESPLSYNMRSTGAFSQKKIQPWPFAGPIVISEKNELDDTQDYFILDKWCLLGKQKITSDMQDFLETSEYRFDVDTYKILLQYIKKHPKEVTVLPHYNFSSLA